MRFGGFHLRRRADAAPVGGPNLNDGIPALPEKTEIKEVIQKRFQLLLPY
jgi:hypothetical protein